MHRERKYRVYDSQNEVMVYNVGIDPHGIAYAIPKDATEDCTSFDYYPDDEPMEFTGIKDKNGTDIYEGDVVRTEHGATGISKWNQEQAAFLFDCREPMWQHPIYGMSGEKELIGNIFRNANLLDKAHPQA